MGVLSSYNFNKNSEITKEYKDSSSNEKLLDSINPSCQDINSPVKYPEKLLINIPESKKWTKNLFQA